MLSHAKNLIRTLTMNECLHILNVSRESKINDLDQSIFLLAWAPRVPLNSLCGCGWANARSYHYESFAYFILAEGKYIHILVG